MALDEFKTTVLLIALMGLAMFVVGAVLYVFADKISQRFFNQFVRDPAKPPRTVTSILRTLSRSFFDTYNNPLGLAYSVYRGIDVAIDWSKKSPRG